MIRFVLLICVLSISFSSSAQDSVIAHASDKYKDPGILNSFFLGRNYRKEWETDVKLPVFHLQQMGFKIKELGGGQQTTSLQVVDPDGREWSLRSVDKNVAKALPERMRKGIILNITQQSISAANPYGPLTIPLLAEKMNVVAAKPVIYFVPDDPAFGEYRSLFANTLCLLEEREPTPDHSDTKSTEKMLDKLFEDNKVQVNQEAVLKARLLDMLTGDWDRHAEQWRWAEANDQYYPIPRDRDQAYFFSNGLLVRAMQVLVLKHLVSYNNDLEKVKSFNYKSWPFDKLFMNSLDKEQWQNIIRTVQDSLTDKVLYESIKQLPPEIYAIRGAELERKLLGRRNKLMEKGMKYYRFLSARVTVYGSDEEEFFHVSGDSRSTVVTVYDHSHGKKGRKLYERIFRKGDTHAITLKGLKGNDLFVVEENVRSGIRLFIEGEEGNDVYNIRGGKRIVVHDQTKDTSKLATVTAISGLAN